MTQHDLSSRQSRLWTVSGETCSPLDLHALALEVPAEWEQAHALGILQQLCARHDSLRQRLAREAADAAPCWDCDPASTVTLAPQGLSANSRLEEFATHVAASAISRVSLPALTVANCPLGPHRSRWLFAVDALRCDMTGLGILLAQWTAILSGRQPPLEEIPPMNAVHTAMRESLQSPQARSMRSYWRRHFLPSADRAAAGLPAPAYLDVIDNTEDLSEALLLCAWTIVLGRTHERRQLMLGVGFEGREAPPYASFVGCLFQCLPFAVTPQWNASAADLLAAIRSAHAVHARLQGSFSWDLLCDNPASASGPVRLDYQLASLSIPTLHPRCRVVDILPGGEPFLLKLACECIEGRPARIRLFFDTTRVRRSQAALLADAVPTVLRQLTQETCVYPATLRLLSPQGRAQLAAEEGGESRPDLIADDNLSDPWTTPHGFSVQAGESILAGAGILQRAEQRAKFFVEGLKLQPERAVAIGTSASLETVITVLAAIRCGLPFVFIDPTWSAAQQQQVLEKLEPGLLIVPEPATPPVPFVRVISLRELIVAEIGAFGVELARAAPGYPADSAGCIVFTSGTTGCPKLVVLSRIALQNQLLRLREQISLRREDRILLRSPLGCNAAIWEMLLPVYSGGRLCIPETDVATDVEAIAHAIQRDSITVVQLTPALLSRLVEHPQLPDCKSLRLVVCGGERLQKKLVEAFQSRLRCSLLNAYDSPESSTQISSQFGATAPTAGCSSGSIGVATPNTYRYILSSDLDPLLDGTVGRLYVGGTSLARGYHGDSAATGTAFIPDPFICSPGTRLFRTDDLGRHLPDGTIEIVGRADRQLKINALSFDSASIEARLLELPEISGAMVVSITDPDGAGYGVAVITTTHDTRAVESNARAHLSAMLPGPAQPSRYVFLRQLPLTNRGRVDYLALHELARSETDPIDAEPRTATERAVAEVWCSVLKRGSLGIHRDFFLVGGHSLMFVQTITRLRERLSVEIPLKAVFLRPTIASLASYIDELRNAAVARSEEAGA